MAKPSSAAGRLRGRLGHSILITLSRQCADLPYPSIASNFHKVWDSDIIELRISQGDWMVWAGELQGELTAEQVALYQRSADPLA